MYYKSLNDNFDHLAIKCYSDFIDENPYSFTAWYNLGNAYSKSEDFEKEQRNASSRVMGAWKGAVEEVLVDPDSANFKDVIFVKDISGTAFACGEVNSKNQLGGYTGYKGFITAGLKDYTFIEGSTKGFSKYWNEICVRGSRI